jgi:hypothetical protein
MAVKTYSGSCHCGAVRYEADLDLADGSNRCNCSYCRKARIWFTFAKGAERFRRLEGGAMTEYRWTPPGQPHPSLTFSFCSVCGVRTFASGELEALGGTFHAVSVPTLDLTEAELVAIPVRYVNGRDGRYDEVPAHVEAI